MITRVLYPEEKEQYNRVVNHPVQSWEWGDFQIGEGHHVYRLGVFDNNRLISGYSVSFHKIPHTNYSIGTILRGPAIDEDMLKNIKKLAIDEKAIFVKFEPDQYHLTYDNQNQPITQNPLPNFPDLVISPKVAFYPFSHVIDLTKSEDELLSSMHPKTRYNVRVANRYDVKIEEKTNDEGFEIYLHLLFDTTKRQGFYLHTKNYHRHQWDILKKTNIPHIFLASHQNQVISAFMIFIYGNKLFYPYGASLDINRQVKAPNLLMWEVIKFGKSLNLKTFDMWGSLGPNAKETDPGFGFSWFKQGYGGQLVQFVGTYDLVINHQLYKLYNFVDLYRWKFLRLKAKFMR